MANSAAVLNQLMREIDPTLIWENNHQVFLNFHRIFVIAESQPLRDPSYVSIHHNGGYMVRISQNNIFGFTPNPGKLHESIQIRRDLAMKTLLNHLAT